MSNARPNLRIEERTPDKSGYRTSEEDGVRAEEGREADVGVAALPTFGVQGAGFKVQGSGCRV